MRTTGYSFMTERGAFARRVIVWEHQDHGSDCARDVKCVHSIVEFPPEIPGHHIRRYMRQEWRDRMPDFDAKWRAKVTTSLSIR